MTNKKLNLFTAFIQKAISVNQAKDTGMAMVLILLLVAFIGKMHQFIGIAILMLVINMTWPNIFKPVAKIWLGFSHLLGTLISKVILSIVFLGLVTPVGFIRRLLGRDSLQVKKWKKSNGSVFKVRDHKYTPEDLTNPY